MAMTPRLDLRQSQSLVMTPQLQQAIKLLQLSNLELTAYVDQELANNPLLEADNAETADADVTGAAGEEPRASGSEDSGTDSGDGISNDLDADLAGGTLPGDEGMPESVYDNQWTPDGPAVGSGAGGGGGGFDNDDYDLERTLTSEISLRDHLVEQMMLDIAAAETRMVALHLIDNLDDSGYLATPVEDAAEHLGVSIDEVTATLERLQKLDPVGVFARDLAECLALQLRERDRYDPAMQALIENLNLLARRDFARLLTLTGVDQDDLADMVGEIRSLNPKPAAAFDHNVSQPITPDILMRPTAKGGWLIELNNDTLPRVLVNNRYYSQLCAQSRDKKDRGYFQEQLQSANWLVKTLHQRATTILKVATEIVRQQEAFFQKGVHHMRPLVLRDIAEAIGMHESTVSRVTTNKYLATPRGIFELKYFFTSSIASSDGGEAHSAEAVRTRIRILVDNESPQHVLSDDRIVHILQSEGIDIARRTVAKYRDALHIPSSVQRRREKTAVIAI